MPIESTRIDDLAQRHRYASRVLLATLDALPEIKPWDCPPWLRVRILDLADETQHLEDELAELRARLTA